MCKLGVQVRVQVEAVAELVKVIGSVRGDGEGEVVGVCKGQGHVKSPRKRKRCTGMPVKVKVKVRVILQANVVRKCEYNHDCDDDGG